MASAPQIQIEKNVPIAPRTGGEGGQVKYPFKDMKVGDSFVVRLSNTKSSTLPGLQSALINCAKHAIGAGKIATRRLPDGSGFRVWRVA